MFYLHLLLRGLFEVQDANSQKIAPFMNIEPGMRMIGRLRRCWRKNRLHLAALMKNKGGSSRWMSSNDFDELQKRARRAGISNLETRVTDSSNSNQAIRKFC